MSHLTFRRGFAALALCVFACAAGPSWKSYQKSPDYRPPERVHVVIYARASKGSMAYALRAGERLGETLQQALLDEGIEATVVQGALDPPPAPRVEIRLLNWDADSRVARELIGMGAGGAKLVVECTTYLSEAKGPTFHGIVEGSIGGGYEASEDAVDEAARAIAKELATRKRATE